MRLTSSIASSRARRSGLALVTRLCGVRSCTLSLLPPARASRLLDLQRQQALARAEDEEVRLPGLGSYGYVVPDQTVVRQQALELVQHPALAGVAAPVNLGQTLWKTAIFLPRCSVCGCVSGVQQVIALGAPRRLALRMRAESAAGLSNQKGYFKKAISARWTSAFSYEKMSNRCLGPMDALPRAHSSGQGLGWAGWSQKGATPVPKLSVCRCDPRWDCCKKESACHPPVRRCGRFLPGLFWDFCDLALPNGCGTSGQARPVAS